LLDSNLPGCDNVSDGRVTAVVRDEAVTLCREMASRVVTQGADGARQYVLHTYQTTRCHNQEDHSMNTHRLEYHSYSYSRK
jgi:hypothetical protein